MAEHNYINKLTMIGMMNKNCHVIDTSSSAKLSFAKSKNESKIVAFSTDFKLETVPERLKQISFMYLDDEPSKKDFTSIYSLEEIVSEFDAAKFFDPNTRFQGKEFIEARGTINKWSKRLAASELELEDLDSSNLQEVLEMLEKWRYLENGGMKYGWQERAGCDKALVSRIVDDFEGIKSKVICKVFKLSEVGCIGYSCIEKNPSVLEPIPEFKYLTRKVLNLKGTRNLTEFIDWKTFESIWLENNKLDKFLVNWGASSGGVHWYKTHKWPLHSLETKWFASKKFTV